MTESVSAYRCPRCEADPQPKDFGSPRRCAFTADGSFTPENWICATIDALLEIAATSFEQELDSETLEGVACEPEERGGWILLARYKHRGCTSRAIHFGDKRCEPLTLALAEETIAYHIQP